MKRKTRTMHAMRTAIAVSAAACAAGLSTPVLAQISGDTIKIGMITDLSGVYSDIDGNGVVSLQTWNVLIDHHQWGIGDPLRGDQRLNFSVFGR